MKKFAFLTLATAPLFAEGASPAPTQSLTQTFLMVGVAILFFYLILWRPEQKRRKLMDAQRASMKKGDTVHVMGLVAKIEKIGETTVTITSGSSTLECLKAAISHVETAPNSVSDEKPKKKSAKSE